MKIVHLHSRDLHGGGGGTVAMERLHRGLLKAGHDSRVICGKKTSDSKLSTAIPRYKGSRWIESRLRWISARAGLNDIHFLNSFRVRKMKEYARCDLLHIHGVHGFFNYLAIPGLTRSKPAVLTLHDAWPFTGHCAVHYDCDRWKTGCGRCPYPEAIPPVERDSTATEWKLKNWVYERSNLAIISLSSRLTEQANQSMLGRFPVFQIPNGIDTSTFRPLDRSSCRDMLGIPDNMKVIMFAALNLAQYNKGGDLLVKALQELPQEVKNAAVLLVIGEGGEKVSKELGIRTVDLGYIRGDLLKPVAYSAADLYVSPSRAESFGLVIAESMACGTPVVAFDVGGVPDLVREGQTGYLVDECEASALSRSISHALADRSALESMRQQCRAIIEEEFTLDLQIEQHVKLYEDLVESYGSDRVRNGS